MLTEEIRYYLKTFHLCSVCLSRYDNENLQCIDITEVVSDNPKKRFKQNVCAACFGIFQNLDSVANEIIENSSLKNYQCDSIYSSIQIPIALLIRELTIWIALIQKFPGQINEDISPCITIKDMFKSLFNKKLCERTNRNLELHQNGILVNLIYDYDLENEEIQKLLSVKPFSLKNAKENRRTAGNMTRNFFEKHYFPKNLNLTEYHTHISIPVESIPIPIKLVRYSIVGPTIFIAGRYRKLSRDLSQTPWLVGGKRLKEGSIQETISNEICPYFEVDHSARKENSIFMGSGREDIDVRCLGEGRPFALQISDAIKVSLPKAIAANMEWQIDCTKDVSVQYLQMVKREHLAHIKVGEEQKKKIYRALCVLKYPVNMEILGKLDIPKSFVVQQKTPLRVLHRRPLLVRPREIFSVKGFMFKGHPKVIILDIVTQAGAYIKELIHGEFGRTSPSISSIIGQSIDIVALDVTAIDLDWPMKVSNKNQAN